MQKHKRKLVAFDIDTKVAEKILGQGYRIIYANIERHFKQNGFNHIQGSAYSSREGVSDMQVAQIIDDLITKYPYLEKCIRDARQANVINEQSLNIHLKYDGTPGKYAKLKKQKASNIATRNKKAKKKRTKTR